MSGRRYQNISYEVVKTKVHLEQIVYILRVNGAILVGIKVSKLVGIQVEAGGIGCKYVEIVPLISDIAHVEETIAVRISCLAP